MIAFEGFTASQTCKITGLSYSTLDYWDRSEFLKPSLSEGHGTGSKRIYSFSDLVALRVAAALRDKGISLQNLRRVIAFLMEQGDNLIHPLTGTVFVTDGRKVFSMTSDKEILVDLISGGQLVWAFAVDKLVNGLERRAKRIAGSEVA